MPERYPDAVVERFCRPQFALERGATRGNAIGAHGAIAAGGRVEIHLWLNPDKTLTARFRAYGNPATLAAADWLCAQLDGLPVPAELPPASDIVRHLSLPRRSEHAAFLAERALAEALSAL